MDEEMRKQAAHFAHKMFVTVQETAEGNRGGFLEQLWKKFSAEEEVAARPPYARDTLMLTLTGLKVWELNMVMRCADTTWDAVERSLARTDKLRGMVSGGVPHSLRPQIWMRLAGIHTHVYVHMHTHAHPNC